MKTHPHITPAAIRRQALLRLALDYADPKNKPTIADRRFEQLTALADKIEEEQGRKGAA